MTLNISSNGVVSIPKAVMGFTIAGPSIVINIAVFIGIGSCNLTPATRLLMRSQLCVNGVGVASAIMLISVPLTGQRFSSNSFIDSLPGAIGVFGVYLQMSLLLCMAGNRYVVFCHANKTNYWFSKSRTKLYILLSVCYGMFHGLTCLLPCCCIVIDPKRHKLEYIGDGKSLKQAITLVNDMVILPTALVCYALTLKYIRKIRNLVTIEELKKMRYKTEKRILLQFLTVAGVWFLYCILFRTQYFIPALAEHTVWVVISDSFRLLVFEIDPIVYFCFMRKLRRTIWKKLCCCFFNGTVQAVNLPRELPRINNLVQEANPMN